MGRMRGNMDKSRAKELAYYLFFGLMIFAKGIGLDSGDKLYYALSAIACLGLLCKLILTKYKIRQMVAMILLGFIAFLAYRNSGRMGILLSVLAVIGLKEMDVKKLFKLGAVIYTGAFTFTLLAAKLGLISNPLAVHEKGGIEVIRWGMGYSTGNVFHISYFMLTVLLCYTWGNKYNIKRFAVLMAGNFFVFLFSLSYTGVAVTVFYLLLELYAVHRKRLSRPERLLCQLPLPLCLLFSFGAPLGLGNPMLQKLDHILQARLTFSAYYLQNQPITLFGTRMREVPYFWVIMDNGYVYFLMTFGIVAFVLLCVGYGILIARYSKSDRLPELAMIFSFLLYGIMEQFISNAFMNFSLLFMGEVLFGENCGALPLEKEQAAASSDRGKKEGRDKQKALGKENTKYMAGMGILTGTIAAVLHLLLSPMPSYVNVPLTSLNYVDARSVMIHVENKEGTKEALKQRMEQYTDRLRDKDMVETALQNTGLAEKLTPEEVTGALEWDLPQSVQESRIYDTFRVRLIELYYDISDAEYAALLEELVQEMQQQQYAKTAEEVVYREDAVYREQIGKSFGTDRIEHMSNKQYMVEKCGKIVQIEYIRNVIFAAVFGTVAGCSLAAVLLWKKERK